MLSVRDLTFCYKAAARPALDAISFSLKRGEILGLLGVNGAGKSTIVALIAGLLVPSQGQILVDGRIARLGRHDVAYVPQEYAFYEQLTVRQNLDYFASVQGISSKSTRQQSIARVVRECQLDGVIAQRAYACSGGEKRRVNLAISLLKVPELLILDEPTAGVDPQARAAIIQLVQKLNRQGTTIVYTSHLLHEVQSLCDYLVLIHKGKLLREGSKHDLLDAEAKTLKVQLHSLDQDQKSKLNRRFSNGFSVDIESQLLNFDLQACGLDIAGCVVTLAEMGLSIKSIDGQAENLEALFLTLTQAGSDGQAARGKS